MGLSQWTCNEHDRRHNDVAAFSNEYRTSEGRYKLTKSPDRDDVSSTLAAARGFHDSFHPVATGRR